MLNQYVRDPVVRYELRDIQRALPGIVLQVLSSLIQQSGFTLSRGTTLPTTVPSEVTIFVLNRQATAQGDIVYISLQKSTGQWAYFQILKAT